MMPRSTRRNFSTATKAAMIRRATDANGQIRCEGCGVVLKRKDLEFDHVIPEGLVSEADKQRKLTPADGHVLGRDCCHRGKDSKTSKDQARIAKAKRQEAKDTGAVKPKGGIKSRGFAKKDRRERTQLPPRPMYEVQK